MTHRASRTSTLLAAAIGAVLVAGTVAAPSPVSAEPQSQRERRAERESRSSRNTAKVEERYPNSTRDVKEGSASRKFASELSKMNDLYAEEDLDGARQIADEIIADPDANEYEQAYAAQLAAQAAYVADEIDAAIAYQQKVVELDSLDNNSHFNAMLNLAQMQAAAEQYAESVETFDRFFAESGSTSADDLVAKGQALYYLERYDEAAETVQQAINATDEPKPQWQSLLMQIYLESDNVAGAVQQAEQVAAAQPDDRRALLNLAVVYQQADMMDKAIEVLERLRAGGQLETASEYNQLYVTYLNMEGYERQAAEVITEGLDKGVIEPDFNTYLALAQAYYFSDQPGPAIEAYRKAAPLDDDGETYLNLAKVLYQEDRPAEAAQAAQQALDKGVNQPDQARDIINAGR